MKRIGITLSDKQYEELNIATRRDILRQLMFIHTPKYMYCLGALGAYWTIARFDRQECIGKDTWPDNYQSELVDKWI